jgi:hypothetical protein
MVSISDRMVCAYRKEYDKNPVFTLFITILIVFFIVFIAAVLITGGSIFYNFLNSPATYVFLDHFDSILYSSDRPYGKWGVIYPPLATVFYAVLGHFIIPFVDVPAGTDLTSELIRDSQAGILSLVFMMLIAFYALYILYSKFMKDAEIRKELLFLFAVLLAYPFIYAVVRGNSIILVLVFCLIFLMGYRSENKLVRYASYIALGITAGFKLYTAILGLLILKDRRYREAGICALIVAALVFIPFIFTDGGPMVLFDTIFGYASTRAGVTNFNQMVCNIFGTGLGFSDTAVSVISYAVVNAFTILSFLVILFDKEMKMWKVVALIACNLVLGPSVGVAYQAVYMILPIMYFLASEKNMSRENVFYVICFAMTMVLIPWREIGSIESAFVVIIAVAILYEGLVRMYRNRRSVANPT